jgi:putative PIN family toxin of toxin-antitoxin system
VRAVLDPNVIISALLSPKGSPARVLVAWEQGAFELVASPALIEELERALAYPKLRRLIPEPDAAAAIAWLREGAEILPDPPDQPSVRSPELGDDYLITLAAAERIPLVSGDKHLLGLADKLPILTPTRFLELLPSE